MNNLKNIFLIEDDEHDQYFFEVVLQSIAGAVLCGKAIEGHDALCKLQKATVLPDIIFTDLHMPGMEGLACISELKRRPLLWQIPVIVLSSDTSKADVAKRIGARAFIKKPASINLLKDKVAMLVHLDYTSANPIADRTFDNYR